MTPRLPAISAAKLLKVLRSHGIGRRKLKIKRFLE